MKYLEGQVRIPSGCAISAVISKDGNKMTGAAIMESMKPMHERSNGLGGGFAAYGIYPDYKDCFALHLFFHDNDCRAQCERYLKERLEVVWAEEIPTRKIPEITDEPLIWRYFATPLRSVLRSMQLDEQEYIARIVMYINRAIDGAYVFSSGKDMGCFKAVGYPEDVGRFYKLDEYEGYSWTAHGRYPTNTPGWWGGAHPFGLLNWSVVHNGEISSYDANRRFIEMYGYHCALQTDTEAITYIVDYLLRRQGLTLEETASVIAAPFWDLSYPAILKIYLERISVTNITFGYDEQGNNVGLCKAGNLVYITTSGGEIGEKNYGYDYLKGLSQMFGISRTHCLTAEGLDVWENDPQAILNRAKKQAEKLAASL